MDDQGTRRTTYELDAVAVGHDLARGVDKFARRRAVGSSDMVNDEASAATIAGERTQPIEYRGRPDDLPPDHELFEDFDPALVDNGPRRRWRVAAAAAPMVTEEEMAGVR